MTWLALLANVLVAGEAFAETVVYTVNYPLAYFAERIGGDRVKVRFAAPPGVDPAFWRPDPETILAYQGADLILINGAGYAKWIDQASLPRRKVIDTSRSFRARYLRREIGPVHRHGPGGAHTHGQLATTTWLDPKQAIEQARAIESALVEREPDSRADLEERAEALVADLEQLDRELAEAFAPMRGRSLVASHPVYDYLARRYDLDLRSLVWEPDEDPGAAGWQALDTLLAEHDARWMIWEATPLAEIAEGLETRGIGVVVFDVAGNRTNGEDYLATMRENAARLRAATPADE